MTADLTAVTMADGMAAMSAVSTVDRRAKQMVFLQVDKTVEPMAFPPAVRMDVSTAAWMAGSSAQKGAGEKAA